MTSFVGWAMMLMVAHPDVKVVTGHRRRRMNWLSGFSQYGVQSMSFVDTDAGVGVISGTISILSATDEAAVEAYAVWYCGQRRDKSGSCMSGTYTWRSVEKHIDGSAAEVPDTAAAIEQLVVSQDARVNLRNGASQLCVFSVCNSACGAQADKMGINPVKVMSFVDNVGGPTASCNLNDNVKYTDSGSWVTGNLDAKNDDTTWTIGGTAIPMVNVWTSGGVRCALPALATPVSVDFLDTYSCTGLQGTISISKATNEHAIQEYRIYYGSDNETKLSSCPLLYTRSATGGSVIQKALGGTHILPNEATHILIMSANRYYEGTGMISVKIDDKADVLAPQLLGVNPAWNATDVWLSTNVVLTFDETVQSGTGNLILVASTPASSISIPISDPQVVFSGSVVTINPSSSLADSVQYVLSFNSGVITDFCGNSFDASTSYYAFNTVLDGTAPTVIAYSPSQGETGVSVFTDITLAFNEHVIAGLGNIVLSPVNATPRAVSLTIAVADSKVIVSNNVVTVLLNGTLPQSQAYEVIVGPGTFTDVAGNAFAGMETSYLFTVITDEYVPAISEYSPTQGATRVSAASDIILTFNEAVLLSTGGILTLAPSVGPSLTILTPSDAIVCNKQILTLNTSSLLVDGVQYTITMSAGLVFDEGGNMFAGLSGTSYQFSTEDVTKPSILSYRPPLGAHGVYFSSSVVLSFNEIISAGEGSAILTSSAGSSTIFSVNGMQVGFDATNLVIKPQVNLLDSMQYTIALSPNAIMDINNNTFDGLEGSTYQFTTMRACDIQDSNNAQGAGCQCNDAYEGYISWTVFTDNGTCEASCDVESDTRTSWLACNCTEGDDRYIPWANAFRNGSCSPAACAAANSNNAPGWACRCNDGFTGTITWSGAQSSSQCIPAPCSIANTVFSGPACSCSDGFDGNITWLGTTASGSCSPAPCYVDNSNMLAGVACACSNGYAGSITWNGASPIGTCAPAPCNVLHSNHRPGLECQCIDTFTGSVSWIGSIPSGTCTPPREFPPPPEPIEVELGTKQPRINITLLGSMFVTIGIGTQYVDAGATCVDSEGRSLSPVERENTVNTSVASTYYVTWECIDAQGHKVGVSRRVKVVDRTPPAISLFDNATAPCDLSFWQCLLKRLDKNNDGAVNVEEFLTELGGCATCSSKFYGSPSGCKACSKNFTSDSPHLTTVSDFKQRIQEKFVTPQDAFDAADVAPNDGKISLQELMELGKQLKPPELGNIENFNRSALVNASTTKSPTSNYGSPITTPASSVSSKQTNSGNHSNDSNQSRTNVTEDLESGVAETVAIIASSVAGAAVLGGVAYTLAMQGAPMQLVFEAEFSSINQTEFIAGIRQGLGQKGLSAKDVEMLEIALCAGSVIADIKGPFRVMRRVNKKEKDINDDMEVCGWRAKVVKKKVKKTNAETTPPDSQNYSSAYNSESISDQEALSENQEALSENETVSLLDRLAELDAQENNLRVDLALVHDHLADSDAACGATLFLIQNEEDILEQLDVIVQQRITTIRRLLCLKDDVEVYSSHALAILQTLMELDAEESKVKEHLASEALTEQEEKEVQERLDEIRKERIVKKRKLWQLEEEELQQILAASSLSESAPKDNSEANVVHSILVEAFPKFEQTETLPSRWERQPVTQVDEVDNKIDGFACCSVPLRCCISSSCTKHTQSAHSQRSIEPLPSRVPWQATLDLQGDLESLNIDRSLQLELDPRVSGADVAENPSEGIGSPSIDGFHEARVDLTPSSSSPRKKKYASI